MSDTAEPRRVKIEFCTNCGYASKYKVLEKTLKAAFPGLVVEEISGEAARSSSMEVTSDQGEVLWSKLGGQGYPQPRELVDILRQHGY